MTEDDKETRDYVREGFLLIADELDAQRDMLQNVNLPVLQGIAAIMRKLEALTEDHAATQKEVADLRRVVGLRAVQ